MLFNSLTFLVFFSAVVLLDRSIRSWRARKIHLLLASYLFYAAWNPPLVFLVWLSTVVDWFAAKWIAKSQSAPHRRLLLFASLLCNFGLLSFFKYGQFLLDNFAQLLALFGVQFEALEMNIILPIGISFYTFQTVSYTIDVFRNKQQPSESFLDFALYVTFFPQLVAGPIVRASQFMPQCIAANRASTQQLGWGLSLLVFGLFEKVVLADNLLAPVANAVFNSPLPTSIGDAWVGTLAFSGQIFFDFAGYSTCAIAVALSLGFILPDNFRCPYASIGFSDFWRRWHISLSSWLRDYLYIPLGGNRKGAIRTYVNLMLTMLIGGLWHGASWLFVVWGGLHGFYLVVERGIRHLSPISEQDLHWTGKVALSLITFFFTIIAWVFFRAEQFEKAWNIILAMFGRGVSGTILSTLDISAALLVVALMLACHGLLRNISLADAAEKTPNFLRVIILASFIVCLIFSGSEDNAFIYFQF